MDTPFSPTPDLVVLPSSEPVPGLGVLPVNSFLIRGSEPILVDAGIATERAAFLDALDTVLDPRDLRWILLTHEDADHAGALEVLMDRAPQATLVTNLLGMAKLGSSMRLAPERVRLVRPGSMLKLGRFAFEVHRPPMYDSPATLAFLEATRGWLFASDALAAFIPAAVERADEVAPSVLAEGMSLACRMNSPWLATADRIVYKAQVDAFAALRPTWTFGSHLPPAEAKVFHTLCTRAADLPAEGEVPLPDQAAFEMMMASLQDA